MLSLDQVINIYDSVGHRNSQLFRWLHEHLYTKLRLSSVPVGFVEDLRLLSHGMPVTPPDSKREIEPARIIVMEEPFGRTREGMDELVDFVACIDVPLEIPLARRILRELDGVIQKETSEEYVKQLRDYLNWYVNGSGRDLYFRVNEKAKETCDLVVDGTRPMNEMAQEVVQSVKRKIAG